MTPTWTAITNEADSEYNATLRYDSPWYGSDQLPELTGPDGHNDPQVSYTLTVSTNAPTGKFPGNRRYLATPA